MVRCHSGAFATSVGQKRLTEEKGRGKIFPNKVPTISYTSAVSESFDSEGKKTKNLLQSKYLSLAMTTLTSPYNQTARDEALL